MNKTGFSPSKTISPSSSNVKIAPPRKYDPSKYLTYIVNQPSNRNLKMQGKKITDITSGGNRGIYNSNLFGNTRFRPKYKLEASRIHGLVGHWIEIYSKTGKPKRNKSDR